MLETCEESMEKFSVLQTDSTAANKGFGVIGAGRWNFGCSSLSAAVSA